MPPEAIQRHLDPLGLPSNPDQNIIAAHEAGASKDEAVFDENLKRLATQKPKPQNEKGSHAAWFIAAAAAIVLIASSF